MKNKSLIFCLSVLMLLCWCSNTAQPVVETSNETADVLTFNADNYEVKTLTLDDEEINVRAYEGIVYVANPVDTGYEIMNIYVPEAYYNWEEINWFTLETAPIFFPNKVGWYMPASPETLWDTSWEEMMGWFWWNGNKPEWMKELPEWMQEWDHPFQWGIMWWRWNQTSVSLYALKDWYIVASAWARWRTASNWKAPAWIVDLKAAIRYLKYNDDLIPWDSNKIISNWTSAGWAMSVLLWATANNPDYDKYLEEIWAADATDDLFAISAYCPITNLDNADMAYEWEFYWVDSYSKISAEQLDYNADRSETEDSTVSESEKQYAKELKDMFPAYVNSLWLDWYSLDENWEWSFKETIKSKVIESFNEALADWNDLSSYTWLTINDWAVTNIDFENYIANYMNRNKWIPAFDAFDLSAWENNLFGNETVENRHFTDYSFANTTVEWSEKAPEDVVKVMNPMNYIEDANTTVSPNWRIRHWAKDADTSLAIPFILAKTLEQKAWANVDFKYPWDQWHGWDYDVEELLEWMNNLTH